MMMMKMMTLLYRCLVIALQWISALFVICRNKEMRRPTNDSVLPPHILPFSCRFIDWHPNEH